MAKRKRKKPPVCPYCGKRSQLVDGYTIYPQAGPWLGQKRFWHCAPCNAYVGCHPGTRRPMGRLANAELRRWKIRAHEAFDALWKTGPYGRSDSYRWLAEQLGIPAKQCHIGMFDVETCMRVVELCSMRVGGLSA